MELLQRQTKSISTDTCCFKAWYHLQKDNSLRWPERIFMRVGYVFYLRFSE